uniref:hypothetical protein n=1 Tax=Trichocoleus desertorum TaxID=1481672 RepID=UPI0025B43227|nr:hypothetical protein [Trichocoleus desertorum]
MTIQFNEQWEQLPGGRIKFGLRGGELRLKLDNGEISLQDRELGGSFDLAVQKERQQQEGSENQSGIETTWADSKPGAKANISEKQTTGRSDKFQFTSCQITTKGSEENPAWVFEVKTGEPVLKGLLKSAKIGVLGIAGKPCQVEATFGVTLRDVHLTDAEGLWSPNISREKRAVLDRALAKQFLKHKLQPYLSRVELHYV